MNVTLKVVCSQPDSEPDSLLLSSSDEEEISPSPERTRSVGKKSLMQMYAMFIFLIESVQVMT